MTEENVNVNVRLANIPLRRAVIIQTLVTRLVCQPATSDHEDFIRWIIGEGNVEEPPPGVSNVHAIVGDFITQQKGWILGGTVGLIFRIDDEDEPTTPGPNWLVDTYAEWANDPLWDFLSTNLRTLTHLCLGASQAIDLPLEPPAITLQRFQEDPETKASNNTAVDEDHKG
ncbi:hypothetical protein [Schaalia cardiffensis]